MNTAQHLNDLAAELTTAGWTAHLEDPGLLLVHPPESEQASKAAVLVKAGVGGVPWFVSSTGNPLRPCHDPAGAARAIGARDVPHKSTWPRRLLSCVRERLHRSSSW